MDRCVSHRIVGLAGMTLLAGSVTARAQGTALPPVSIGAGVQTSYVHDMPDGGDSTDKFLLNSVRLYVSGIRDPEDQVHVQHRVRRRQQPRHRARRRRAVRHLDKVNIWVGRLLPPSDRANLYGPYYAHHWAVYTDGVQDGYPFVATGRDNGVCTWGQFDKLQGLEAASSTANRRPADPNCSPPRACQVDFWDPEAGYYLNGTYYGDKNLLAVGGAGQVAERRRQRSGVEQAYGGFPARKEGGRRRRVLDREPSTRDYDKLGGYDPRYAHSHGGYVLGSFLFPPAIGMTGTLRDPRQVRQGHVHRAGRRRPIPTTRRRRRK